MSVETSFQLFLEKTCEELNKACTALRMYAKGSCCQTVCIRQCELGALMRVYSETLIVRDWNTVSLSTATCSMCNGCNEEVDAIMKQVRPIIGE